MCVLLQFRWEQIERQYLEIRLGKEALMWHTALFQAQIDQLKAVGDPQLQKKFNDSFKPLVEESLQLRQKSDFAELSAANMKTLLSISKIFLILGVLLIFTGFTLWYFKLQRYQDRLVRIIFRRRTHDSR